MSELNYNDTYGRWRRMILRINSCLVLGVFAAEVMMYFLLKWRNLILQTLPVYLYRFLVLPSILNVLILLTGILTMKEIGRDKKAVNYVPVVQLAGICLVVAMVHNIFSVTLCIFCFPILLTILFEDKSMTRQITALCTVMLFITLWYRKNGAVIRPAMDFYLVPEGVVTMLILLATHIFSIILIQFQKEKSLVMADACRRQAEMQKMLDEDQKTGLHGVDAFTKTLADTVKKAREETLPPILVILNIDDFKTVNDSFGRVQGEQALLRLAELIRQSCGTEAYPARLSGEEFAIIYRGTELSEVGRRMDKLRLSFLEQDYDFTDRKMTVSIGIARWKEGWSGADWFNHADCVLYDSPDGRRERHDD